ncbi:hypothetical protein DPMN_107989 [Dreissena polymorpha]|uniref:Uncharacterized protein n=1 Tax=Dreissena polymorpha TaxID=45954 RepID=A0A9D4K874_DREPO|nr:hypothetical protein DPMN_107989 [Dreissena polymorpha]
MTDRPVRSGHRVPTGRSGHRGLTGRPVRSPKTDRPGRSPVRSPVPVTGPVRSVHRSTVRKRNFLSSSDYRDCCCCCCCCCFTILLLRRRRTHHRQRSVTIATTE